MFFVPYIKCKHSIFEETSKIDSSFKDFNVDDFLADGSKFIHYVPNSLFINVKIAFRPQSSGRFHAF